MDPRAIPAPRGLVVGDGVPILVADRPLTLALALALKLDSILALRVVSASILRAEGLALLSPLPVYDVSVRYKITIATTPPTPTIVPTPLSHNTPHNKNGKRKNILCPVQHTSQR